MSPLVSVVIPVFNGAPFVAKAVASVCAQTVKDVEIIVVDDGSTDGTQAVLQGLERTAGITWLQQDHGGPARSRNRGIEAAHGRYVALLDCDDTWLPDKLALQIELMQSRPELGVVHSDFEIVDAKGTVLQRIVARHSGEPLVQAFAGGHIALPSTLLIDRRVLETVGALNPDLYGSEDSDLAIRLYAVTQFECVDRVLVRKLERGHVRELAFEETTHWENKLSSREQFLNGLERMGPLNRRQRTALDREWTNYFLGRGHFAERRGLSSEARHFYRSAIAKSPLRLRCYTRWLRTFVSKADLPGANS
jgi:glycosyltransferase involved in cell wall biosynthesis